MVEPIGDVPDVGLARSPARIPAVGCMAAVPDYQYRDGVHLAPAVGIPLRGTVSQVPFARQSDAQLGGAERGGADNLCYHVHVGASTA